MICSVRMWMLLLVWGSWCIGRLCCLIVCRWRMIIWSCCGINFIISWLIWESKFGWLLWWCGGLCWCKSWRRFWFCLGRLWCLISSIWWGDLENWLSWMIMCFWNGLISIGFCWMCCLLGGFLRCGRSLLVGRISGIMILWGWGWGIGRRSWSSGMLSWGRGRMCCWGMRWWIVCGWRVFILLSILSIRGICKINKMIMCFWCGCLVRWIGIWGGWEWCLWRGRRLSGSWIGWRGGIGWGWGCCLSILISIGSIGWRGGIIWVWSWIWGWLWVDSWVLG